MADCAGLASGMECVYNIFKGNHQGGDKHENIGRGTI